VNYSSNLQLPVQFKTCLLICFNLISSVLSKKKRIKEIKKSLKLICTPEVRRKMQIISIPVFTVIKPTTSEAATDNVSVHQT